MKRIMLFTVLFFIGFSTIVTAHDKVVVIPLYRGSVITPPPTTTTLNMLIVMDRSGSMQGANWDGSKIGLSEFFVAQSSSGVNIGMNFFPVQSAADQCNIGEHNPIQVPFGQLTEYSPTLITELGNQNPTGATTPTYAALYGSLAAATNYKDNNSEQDVIVVLITDGSANECNTNINDIAGLATSALNYNGVRTYTIAIQGASVADLNTIATAGGTQQAYDVTSDISLLKTKMDEILANALGL